MHKEALLETAHLMRNGVEAATASRTGMAQHLNGSLVPVVFESDSNKPHDSIPQQPTTHPMQETDNYTLLGSLMRLLPQHDPHGNFKVHSPKTLRALQAHVIWDQHNALTPLNSAYYYIIGQRAIRLSRKPRTPLTELILWPAADKVTEPDSGKQVQPLPKTAAVMTSHYLQFRKQASINPTTKPNDDIVFGSVLNWWRNKPIMHHASGKPATIHMHSPKKRWGYIGASFEAAISDSVIRDFGILGNLVTLHNDFEQGEAAARIIEQAVQKP